MEDAMVINKGSYERGFGHASVYKSEVNEPPHGKTNNLHRRKQRGRSASQ